MIQYTLLDLPTFSDPRGALTVLDKALPFVPVRTYWIYGADGHTRGGHRHRLSHQALVALQGSVSVFMDDGVARGDIVLDAPSRCLLVEPHHWHTMTFGPGSVLLVMSSQPYDRADYIDEPYG